MYKKKNKQKIQFYMINRAFFHFFCTLVCFYFAIQPVRACKLWAVFSKAGTFSTLSLSELQEVEIQLTSFFHQSTTMMDGWSLLSYSEINMDSLYFIQRSNIPASQDSTLYWSSVETILNDSTSSVALGHLRMASSGANSIPNPHPWIFFMNGKSFSLIHNGTVNKNILYNLITDDGNDISWLESNPPKTFGGGDWKDNGWGNVIDSELILLFVMQHYNLNGGDLVSGLQSSLSRLINAGVSASQLNLIFSDGENLYAFGGSERLFFTESEDHFSIMTTPSQSNNLYWDGIENQELLKFSGTEYVRYPNFVSIEYDEEIILHPDYFLMGAAYPNPFNGSVSFAVNSTKSGPVLVSIFSIHGKLVNQFKSSVIENSSKVIRWIPESTVSTGTYFVSVNSNQFTQSQKILFIK